MSDKDKEKDIYCVLSKITFVLLVVVVSLLVDAIYKKEDLYVNIVSVVILLFCYVYQKKQIKPR